MTSSSASFVGSSSQSALRQPCPRSQPAQPMRGEALADPLERLLERGRALEAHLSLGDRPAGEVDVRVGESRYDAPSAEVDDLRRGERGLVRADAAGNPVARDRQRPGERQRPIERPDRPVLEDHARECSPCSTTSRPRLRSGGVEAVLRVVLDTDGTSVEAVCQPVVAASNTVARVPGKEQP